MVPPKSFRIFVCKILQCRKCEVPLSQRTNKMSCLVFRDSGITLAAATLFGIAGPYGVAEVIRILFVGMRSPWSRVIGQDVDGYSGKKQFTQASIGAVNLGGVSQLYSSRSIIFYVGEGSRYSGNCGCGRGGRVRVWFV